MSIEIDLVTDLLHQRVHFAYMADEAGKDSDVHDQRALCQK